MYTVREEIRCYGDSEILHELERDTTRISSWFSDFRKIWKMITYNFLKLISTCAYEKCVKFRDISEKTVKILVFISSATFF